VRVRPGVRTSVRAVHLIDDWRALARLRLRARQHAWPWLLEGEVWDRYVRGAQGVGDRAASQGRVRLRRIGGDLVARVCSFPDVDPFTGAEVERVSVDFDLADADSAAWAAQEVDRLAKHAGPALDFMIETVHVAALLPVLLRRGYGVSARLMMGKTKDVLDSLSELDVRRRLAEAGLTVRDATAADVAEMVQLNVEVFTEFPEHCWFGAHDEYVRRLRSELETTIDGSAPPRVFDANGVVAGWYSYEPARDVQWGASGGMGIVFGERARGRGLLRVAYRDIASRLDGLSVPAYRGGTSQPAVLHLARVFDRRTIGVHVRGQHFFGVDHFDLNLVTS
jgi:hypothetical protein